MGINGNVTLYTRHKPSDEGVLGMRHRTLPEDTSSYKRKYLKSIWSYTSLAPGTQCGLRHNFERHVFAAEKTSVSVTPLTFFSAVRLNGHLRINTTVIHKVVITIERLATPRSTCSHTE